MPEYLVRLEQVAFTEVKVSAGSPLLARNTVMNKLSSDDAVRLLEAAEWQDGGLNVESAREVASNAPHNTINA